MQNKWMALALALVLAVPGGTVSALAAEADSGSAPAQEAQSGRRGDAGGGCRSG